MKLGAKAVLAVFLFAGGLLLGSVFPGFVPGQDVPQAAGEEALAEPEEIRPEFRDIKEEIAAYVFLGWLWISILVLIYVLREKIRESDRLHRFAFFNDEKKQPPAE